jgi:hypothetical protein
MKRLLFNLLTLVGFATVIWAVTPVVQPIVVLAAYREGGVPYWPSPTATIADVQSDNLRQMAVWGNPSSYGDYSLSPQSYGWFIVPRTLNGTDACSSSNTQAYGAEVERQAIAAGVVYPPNARISIQSDCGHSQRLYYSTLGTLAPFTDGKTFNHMWCSEVGLSAVQSIDSPLVGTNHFDPTTPCGQAGTPYSGSVNGNERWRKGWLFAPQLAVESSTPTAPETKFIEALELPRGSNIKYWRFNIGAVDVRQGGPKQNPSVNIYFGDRLVDLDPVHDCRYYTLPVGQTYIMLDQSSGTGDRYIGIRNEGFSADQTGAWISIFPTTQTTNTISCPGGITK